MIRAVVVIGVMLGVALSPLALDACLTSCQARTSTLATSAHHACHTDGTPYVSAHAGACGHDHALVADGIIRADQLSSAHARSTATAALPLGAAHLNVAQIIRATSPPRASVALTPLASSAVPLRV